MENITNDNFNETTDTSKTVEEKDEIIFDGTIVFNIDKMWENLNQWFQDKKKN